MTGWALSGCGEVHSPFGAAPTATVTVVPTPTADPAVTLAPVRPTEPSTAQQIDASNLARDMLDLTPPRGYQWNSENTSTLRVDIDRMIALFDGTTRADEVARLRALFGAALDERASADSDTRRWWVTLASLITNGDQARSFEDPLPGYLDPNDHGAGGDLETPSTTTETTAAEVTAEPTATVDRDLTVPPSVPPTSVPVGTDDPNDFEEDLFDGVYQVPIELAPGLFHFAPAEDGGTCQVFIYDARHKGRGVQLTAPSRYRVKATDTEVVATGCIFDRVAR